MIQRHRDTEAVGLAQLLRGDSVPSVVNDVYMGQGRAFRGAGGPGGELDVDRIIRIQGFGNHIERPRVTITAAVNQGAEFDHARRFFIPRADDGTEAGQFRRLQIARGAVRKFGGQLLQHADVVAALEAGGRHQGLASDFVEHVLDFSHTVGWIDRDQN